MSEKSRRISLTVPEPVYEAFKALAARRGLGLNEWIRALLADQMDEYLRPRLIEK